ncbi:hypothetical protein ACIREM_35255 [Streptomyces shenzhenensis]|uniref:hypothetical protein n=1 Tax=Streptomyces shenzhenensis TaxID=943815 RepID=UPI003820CF82
MYEGEFQARCLGKTTGWNPERREVTLDAIAIFRQALRWGCRDMPSVVRGGIVAGRAVPRAPSGR